MTTQMTHITFDGNTKTFDSVALANEWLANRHQALTTRSDERAKRTLEARIELMDLASYSFKIPAGRVINEEWFSEAAYRMPDTHTVDYLNRKHDIRRWGRQYQTKAIA